MGAFIVNFHVRSKSITQVSKSLRQIPVEDGWIAGPPPKTSQWISFWERQASDQNTDRIQLIAESVSRTLKSSLIAFLVHDSDVLCYWLYEFGKKVDEYSSCPSYWGDDKRDETSLSANYEVLLKYCAPDTDIERIEKLLAQTTGSDRTNLLNSEFIVSEQRLAQLAPLFGLREDRLLTDYNDIGRDVRPEDIGAKRLQSKKPSKSSSAKANDREGWCPQMPVAPLYDAAVSGELDAIDRLSGQGIDINTIPHGYTVTALGNAASNGTSQAIRKLVELGADIQKKGPEGASPLRMAIQSERIENLRTLIELGADIDEYDAKFGTLLHIAVMQSSFDSIRVLLEFGLDPNRANANGVTPLQGVQLQQQGLQQAMSMINGASIPAVILDRLNQLDEIERAMSEWSQHS